MVKLHKTSGNPIVKIGDKVVILKSCNNAPEGLATVTNVSSSCNSFTVSFGRGTGSRYSIYNTGRFDTYTFEDRGSLLELKRKQRDRAKKNIKELDAEIKHLELYPTEEAFVAHKLEAILTAHSSNKTKELRTSAITEVLKELKSSDIL